MRKPLFQSVFLLVFIFMAAFARAGMFTFSTGSPNGLMGTASRPGVVESADDFIVASPTTIGHATFAGLLPSAAPLTSLSSVAVEIYRIFPADSANPPSGAVPTRVNSPSDIAFDGRDSAAGTLAFTASISSASFTAANSVVNGIHPSPNQTTGGEGSVTGEEILIDVTFTPAFTLPAGHYFFVPEVALSTGNFLWLSAPRPPLVGDLQSWIRNSNIAPDWLRIGTDIVGGLPPPTFNGSFSLSGFIDVRADFNGDGQSDIVLRNASSADIAEYQMSGTAILGAAVVSNAGTGLSVATVGDYNGDGHADLALQNSNTNDIVLWLMSGNTIIGRALVGNPGTGWKAVGSADLDGDGKADIVLRNQNTGDVAVWLMNGGTIKGGAIVGSPGTSFTVVGAGDFNGDGNADILLQGNADILLQNVTSGDLAEWQLNGLTITAGAIIAGAGSAWKADTIGDSNGDGKADIFLCNQTSGDIAVWQMNGFTIAGGAVVGSPGTAYDIVGAADYNGDGKADILLRDQTTGDIAMWLLNGTVITAGAVVSTPGPSWVPIGK